MNDQEMMNKIVDKQNISPAVIRRLPRYYRYLCELIARGQSVKYEDVLAEMNQRDKQDSTRDVAPTAAADDAVLLDNTGMTFDETVEAVIALAKKKA
jgi:cytidylate kinase